MEEGLNREQIATLFEDFKRFRGFPPTSDSVHFIHLQKRVKKMDVTFEQIRAAWALFWEVPKHGRDPRADYDLDNPWLTFKKALNRLLAQVGECKPAEPEPEINEESMIKSVTTFQPRQTIATKSENYCVTLESLWEFVKDTLRERIGDDATDAWIALGRPLSAEEGKLWVHVPSQMAASFIGLNFRDVIEEAINQIVADPLTVKFCVCESLLEDDEEED